MNSIREVLKPDGVMLSACPVCQGQQKNDNYLSYVPV